jgi:hypothetical protein
MAIRHTNMLTTRQVATAKNGLHSDGFNLYLRVADGGRRKSWVVRFTRNGRVTAMGLRSANAVTLAKARRSTFRWWCGDNGVAGAAGR